MTTGALSEAGVARLGEVVARHVDGGDVPGLVWLLARRGEVHSGALGTFEPDGAGKPVARDTIFRISSMTKPVTAVAALTLVEDCRLRLDDPVDDLLPELAARRVLARPGADLDDTVPSPRPITLRDLLTFRLGLGGDFTGTLRQPAMAAMGELRLSTGPPAPAVPPPPDEWMRRLGTLPLEFPPGDRWLYHTGADVLGVLVARAAGRPFEDVLAERLFEPLGMADTAFWVPEDRRHRFGACYTTDPATGDRVAYDEADGQWAAPPAFPGGGAGLVSTVDDFLAFAEMLLAGGSHRGRRILSRPTVEALTTNQLTPDQLATSAPVPGVRGWGLGVGVVVRRTGPALSVGSYGWDGGMGTRWSTDPAEGLVALLFANQTWTSPLAPPVCQDFLTAAYAAFDD